MAWLPEGPFSLAALVLILAGVAVTVRRDVPKAYALGVLMLAVFLLDTVGALTGFGHVQRELGFAPARLFQGDGWWTPVTSVFTHAPSMGGGRAGGVFGLHVVGNLLLLVTAGPALEARIGGRLFLVVFYAAALGALVAHTILGYATDIVSPRSIAIGASGALFGVLTAFAVRHPRSPLPILLVFIFVSMPAFVVLLIYLGFNLVYMLADATLPGGETVSWWGHFAGFLVGLAFAYRLPKVDPEAIPTGTAGLPDPEKLRPLATTPKTRELLAKIEQFRPEARTRNDADFAMLWVDRFLGQARCPACGRGFRRRGLAATCEGGETRVEFAREG